MRYCTKCGASMKDDQPFCTECGAPANSVSDASAAVADDGASNAATNNPFLSAPNRANASSASPAPGNAQAPDPSAAPTVPLAANPISARGAGGAVSQGPSKGKNNKWLIVAIAAAAVIVFVLVGVLVAGLVGGGQTTDQDRAEREAERTAADNVQYSTYYVVNCKESISLREAANTSSPVIIQIPFGAAVSVIEVAENGFYKVVYEGKTGYALASYLSTTPQSAPVSDTPANDTTYQTMYVVNCQEWITLRTSPSTSASEIIKIPLGAAVSYIESAPDGFYKIAYMGHTGYALASYLGNSPASSSASTQSTVTYRVVNCNEWISLRKSPSTSADRYCTIPLGATVTYYSNAGNGFLKVGYDGYVGYALASYLTPA